MTSRLRLPSFFTDRRKVLLFGGLALGLLLAELDQSVFATALPTVAGELGGVDRLFWINTSFILAGTVAMPVVGRLGDRWGRRVVFTVSLSVFLIGSVVGGLAGDLAGLLLARTIQGLGGGGLLVLIQASVADVLPPRDRAFAMSGIGAVFAVAALVGPVVGGLLSESIGWRWAFWINIPLGLLAIAAAWAWLPHPPPPRSSARLDSAGLVILPLWVTALVLVAAWGGGRHAWRSPLMTALIIGGAAALTAFILAERRAAEPILPLPLFARRSFVVGVGAGLVLAVAVFGTVGYLPTYLQMAGGLTPTRAGLMMLTLMGGLGAATVASAAFVRRTGRYRWPPVAGAGLAALALTLLVSSPAAVSLGRTAIALTLLGLGIGCSWEILVVVVQRSVPPVLVGTATAANGFIRELGVLLGSAVVGAAFTGRLDRLLQERLPPGFATDPHTLTPGLLAQLAPGERALIASAYHDALLPVLAWLVPLLALSGAALLLLRSPAGPPQATPADRPAQLARAEGD